MDMQSVLEASFSVPASTPDWQSELLLRLGADKPVEVAPEPMIEVEICPAALEPASPNDLARLTGPGARPFWKLAFRPGAAAARRPRTSPS